MHCAQIWFRAEIKKEYMPAFVMTKVLLNTIFTILIENLMACAYEY
jgi:hypothetical protein